VAEWDDLMAVNVRSIFLTAKYAVPYMRRQGGGTILNIGSVSSLVGQQGTPCYCASKGAVLMLTRSLALDYGPDGIRANCLCPGITDTPLLRYHAGHADTDPETHLRQRLARVPTAKMLQPRGTRDHRNIPGRGWRLPGLRRVLPLNHLTPLHAKETQ
jgi:NAD(P)-dependent dehydrogenase (short-subunit alcohol dehydrogenase family)